MKLKDILKDFSIHGLYIIALILFIIIFYRFFLTPYDVPAHDLLTGYFPHEDALRQSIIKHSDFFPIWNPYWFSGTPLLGDPGTVHIGSITYFLILVFQSTILALKINFILDLILAAITMYILIYYLTKDKESAFISAFTFVFSGYVLSTFVTNWLTSLNAYLFMPLIFLFTILAFKSKDWIFFSIITAIFFALQVFAGPDLKIVLFSIMLFVLYSIVYIIGKNIGQRVLKAALISCLVAIIFIGLASIRILPEKEYLDSTGRASLPYELAASRVTPLKDVFSTFIEPIYEGFPKIHRPAITYNIGIIAFILMCIGIYKNWRNKIVLTLIVAILISVLIATGSFVFYLLWKYVPPWSSFRYLTRAIILFVFSASILAGYGAFEIFKEIKRKSKNYFFTKRNVFLIISALLVINLLILGPTPVLGNIKEWRNINNVIKDSSVFQEIKKDQGIYRIHVYETNGIDWPTTYITVPLGLEDIYGYQGAWSIDYFNYFLGFASLNPSRLWGILNVKYVTSTKPLNISGFEYMGEFPCGPNCYNITQLEKAKGPYLYKNVDFLPRAYIVNRSLLILGPLDFETQKSYLYPLLLDNRFNPNNAVILVSDKLPEGVPLSKYDAILLSGQPSQSELNDLKSYANNGGNLFPNIFSGDNQINVEKLFSALNGSYRKEIGIDRKSYQDIALKFQSPANGWLVYSETFSLYPGWYAEADGKKISIIRANGVVSAIPLENTDKMELKYGSRITKYGILISELSFLGICLYLIYYCLRHFKRQKL
jgi:hypothetical protein